MTEVPSALASLGAQALADETRDSGVGPEKVKTSDSRCVDACIRHRTGLNQNRVKEFDATLLLRRGNGQMQPVLLKPDGLECHHRIRNHGY
jgi:hypothetical protein